ncbi:S9 family peptidase [Exilibacterium tricleocarpae]|uniref:S9 family peptidase n=1 Tax=Exilibacterium tricleocarpae TaxID=2591008 RepID=A0A545TAQ8_9GAMM|nr:alpha/beta fold hydrolase [Exilibacterium tricleocarpae]TQV74274.1 S9 family peptidase [Exilibacterium tricleocarpae]
MRKAMVSASLLFAACLSQATEQHSMNNGNLILEDIPPIPEQIVTDLNRFQNVRAAGFRGWSQGDDGLYVTTRFGDVSQIHRIDSAGGARRQLTFFQEPVGAVETQPDGGLLAFTMDAGGNEYAQIFLLDTGSGDYEMITDGKSRNGALQWSGDGSMLAYQSTRRNGRSNDIWIATIKRDNSNKYAHKHAIAVESQDGSWWGPSAFDAKGERLLVQQYISATNSLVHIRDLRGNTLTSIAGAADTGSRNYGVDFNAQGNGVFLLTDRYSDFTQLVFADLKSGKETVITKDINWDVTGVTLSKDKSRAAMVVNEGGISRLYLLNTKTFKYRPVSNIPTGVIGRVAFNTKGNQLALSINTAKTPTDTFVLQLGRRATAAGQLQRWTYSEVGGLNTDEFIEPTLIHYPTFDKVGTEARKIPAFLYKPQGDGPFPVVVVIHGGPEAQYRPRFSSTFQLWMQKLGVAVIAPNVRGSSGYGKEFVALDNGFKREDSVKDIGALLDWIDTRKDLDSGRVAVYGGSYGGYMVLASAVHYSDRLKAGVNIVGISNFVTFLTNTKDYRRDLRRVEYGDEREPKMREFLERISPNNNVDKIKIPLLVVQGQNDPRVPVTEAEQIVASLRNSAIETWYMNALNEGHGYGKKENRDVYQQVAVMFLQTFLLD